MLCRSLLNQPLLLNLRPTYSTPFSMSSGSRSAAPAHYLHHASWHVCVKMKTEPCHLISPRCGAALLLIYYLFTTADQELASTQTHGQADTQKHQAGDMQLESDKTTSDHNGTLPQKSLVHIIYTHIYNMCCLDAFVLL